MNEDLKTAWKKRLALMAEGTRLQAQYNEMKKERFSAGKHCRATVWYAAISSYYESEKVGSEANKKFFEADTVWFNALHETRGNVYVDWTFVEGKASGWRCTIEGGEVFEP